SLAGARDYTYLVDHPHIGPVIFKLVTAVEADDVVLACGRWNVPIRVDGASYGDLGGRGKGL
ncbi:MAG TPA: hypothetical protein VIB39_18595, partial [Candidatus Angelobacter sp.]